MNTGTETITIPALPRADVISENMLLLLTEEQGVDYAAPITQLRDLLSGHFASSDSPGLSFFIDVYNRIVSKPIYGGYDPVSNPDQPFVYHDRHTHHTVRMTYGEAIEAYVNTLQAMSVGAMSGSGRAVLPINLGQSGYGCTPPMVAKFQDSTAEIIAFNAYRAYMRTCNWAFMGCNNLVVIDGDISLSEIRDKNEVLDMFSGCSLLREVRLHDLRIDISFVDSPALSKESISCIVLNSCVEGDPIAVTVHPELFAKLTDVSNKDWHKIFTDAAEKNITFKTI